MMKKKNNNFKKALIYTRYLFPLISLFLIFIWMFIPCGAYYDVKEAKLHEKMSAAGNISNSWETVRYYLFSSTSEIDDASRGFGGTALTVIILSVLLFAATVIFAVYFAYSCFKYMKSGGVYDKKRALFLTVVPNRTVSLLYFLLCLPITLYQRLLPLLYDGILMYKIELKMSFADPFVIALILIVLQAILSGICRDMEVSLSMDPFKRNNKATETEETDEQEDNDSDADGSYYSQPSKRAGNDQLEAIRNLLKKDENNKSE